MVTLHSIRAKNFKSLEDVEVPLGPLNVLAGPNGAGKSNVLEVIGFLGDVARYDLAGAIEAHGGMGRVAFAGGTGREPVPSRPAITLSVTASVTSHASPSAPDEYRLTFSQLRGLLVRAEEFKFKRTKGQGRRISVNGYNYAVFDGKSETQKRPLSKESAALATLPKLGREKGGEQVSKFADLLMAFEVFEPNVEAARRPGVASTEMPRLATNAANLADFLTHLMARDEEAFALLQEDMRAILPGCREISVEQLGGATVGVRVMIRESGMRRPIELAEASYGTIRGLALLAKLHDPNPPPLLGLEEIDHGLHPYALERVVERLRAASARTQILVATHSPTLINRLEPDELIICERDEATGATRVPAVTPEQIRLIRDADGGTLGLGELWFTGTLGGVP